MADIGYYVHFVDLSAWLTLAQKSVFVKNKVRKDLWQELVDVIHWSPLPLTHRGDYIRIPRTSFVSMQSFCMIDGKGSDTVSSDQLLNFCTTLDSLRSQLPVRSWDEEHKAVTTTAVLRTPVRSIVSGRIVDVDDDDDTASDSGSVAASRTAPK